MARKSSITSVLIMSIILLGITTPVPAADLPELSDLRDRYVNTKQKLAESYREQLSVLEQNLANLGDSAGAAAVRREKDRVSEEIAELSSGGQTEARPAQAPVQAQAPAPAPVSAPAPVVAEKPKPPIPLPVAKPHTPKTHVSSNEGLAGAANFSKNNVYTFSLAEVGPASSLTFWATGRRSTDTSGDVWLITPGGAREKVSSWNYRSFDKSAEDASSYKRLQPISEDISELVTAPGTYKVEFEWTGGIDPLVIFRVELRS